MIETKAERHERRFTCLGAIYRHAFLPTGPSPFAPRNHGWFEKLRGNSVVSEGVPEGNQELRVGDREFALFLPSQTFSNGEKGTEWPGTSKSSGGFVAEDSRPILSKEYLVKSEEGQDRWCF